MFCDKLRALRVKKDISQKELAKILNVAPTAVCNWEQGTAEPRPDKLRKLAVFFDVSIDSLYEEELEKERNEKNDKKKLLDLYSFVKFIDYELHTQTKESDKKKRYSFLNYCKWLKCKNAIES